MLSTIREIITIGTFAFTIFIAMVLFLINTGQDLIISEYNLGLKPISKKESILKIIIYFSIGFVLLLSYLLFISIKDKKLSSGNNETLPMYMKYFLYIYALILVYISNLKSLVNKCISKSNSKSIRFLQSITIISIIASTLVIPIGIKNIYQDNINSPLEYIKSVNALIYLNDRQVGEVQLKDSFKINPKDNIEILVNDKKVTSDILFNNVISDSSKLNIKFGEEIVTFNISDSIDNEDKIEIKVNDEIVGEGKINLKFKAQNVVVIFDIAAYIIIVTIEIAILYGMYNSIKQIREIKFKEIWTNKEEYIIGKILLERDNFYIIYSNREYMYLQKNVVVKSKDKNIEHKVMKKVLEIQDGLKIKEIYKLEDISKWIPLLKFKKKVELFNAKNISNLTTGILKMQSFYSKVLLIYKIIFVIIVLVLIYIIFA